MTHNQTVAAILAGFVALVGVVFYVDVQTEKEWNAYRDSHHCIVTGHIDSSTEWGTTFDGKFVTTDIPGKILFRCDGGEIIGRSE